MEKRLEEHPSAAVRWSLSSRCVGDRVRSHDPSKTRPANNGGQQAAAVVPDVWLQARRALAVRSRAIAEARRCSPERSDRMMGLAAACSAVGDDNAFPPRGRSPTAAFHCFPRDGPVHTKQGPSPIAMLQGRF